MFDPILASQEIKNSYIDYIATSFDLADQEYAAQFRQALHQEGMVAKGPYLDIGGAYAAGRTLRELMDVGEITPLFSELEPVPEKERELKLERPLYIHQERALRKASRGENLVVTTGTGSGKTECFLLPVLQQLLSEKERGELDVGVRAIIIYPMNALANDQIKRLRKLLKNYADIRFGIYNGNTRHRHSEALADYRKTHKNENGEPQDPLPNEMISREEMQAAPPHILITNYSMLEYMMLRPKDDTVFSGAKLKYIILDEAHIYRGATGMETGLLMRRLRARISKPESVQYILTSATLGGEDADGDIVAFARKLCGVSFETQGIIRAGERRPKMEEERDVDPELFCMLERQPDSVGTLLAQYGLDFCLDGSAEEKLYALCLHCRLFALLRRKAQAPVTVTELHDALREAAPGITREQVVSFISVCARAETDGANLIKPRYHFFVRALEGAFITIASPKELFLQRRERVSRPDGSDQAVFEAAVCSDCGRLAVAGKTENGRLRPFARQGRNDGTEYYLLRSEADGELFHEEPGEEDGRSEEDDGSHDYVLCPTCAAISTEADLHFEAPCEHDPSRYVRVRLVDQTESGQARCPACGFGSFRRFYVGSEAATAVLATELFEQMPTETVTEVAGAKAAVGGGLFARAVKKKIRRTENARQFLCFSDSRSEAAFFATYLERSYQEFLRRRGIWHTAERLRGRGETVVSVPDFVGELTRYFEEERCFAEWDAPERSVTSASMQNAWIAILNEMYNARRGTSLMTMGVLAFAYEPNREWYQDIADMYHLPLSDAAALLELLTQDAVYSGALNAGKEHKLTAAEREYIFFAQAERKLVKVKAGDNAKSYVSGWCGRKRTNGNYYPNTRLARLTTALDITLEDADSFLSGYWDGVFAPEAEQFVLDAHDFNILLGGTEAVRFYRCRKCGRITPHNVQDRCASVKCGGRLEPYEPLEHTEGNHFAQLYRSRQMKPLYIKEHTAQLAKDQQTRYQEAFVNKQIHALSCSTTFEMGVDVGSLETVYLRDVPPSPANYVQRAGRAGRGRGSAAFVMTFAKLSSHDFTYFDEPERMISGKISAPMFEIENEKILNRHVFAVAISAFLKQNEEVYHGDDQTVLLNEDGYERLCAFLEEHPEELRELLFRSIPRQMHERLGLKDWSWIDRLCGDSGALKCAVEDFRGTVAEMEKNQRACHRAGNDEEAAKWSRALRNFRCTEADHAGKKSLISFLVRNNVLPKYGFPVDTVELLPDANDFGKDKDLQLARDLQMAIADYAPGAQVVADGKLYTSRYLRRSPGVNTDVSWEEGHYCPKCRVCGQPNFTKEPIVGSRECVSCHTPIKKWDWKRTLEPRLGFIADVDHRNDPVPMRRPEHDYKTDDYYIGDPHRNLIREQEFYVNGRHVRIASTSNDSLVVVGQTTFHICPVCGYATDGDLPKEHKNARGYPCPNKEGKNREVRLSHDFKTDVVQITFSDEQAGEMNVMLSVLYALLEGLSREMGIERTDIKGCWFRTFEGGQMVYSLILYDAVAGGAGHVRRMVTEDGAAFQRVIRRAYAVVDGCDCGSSCYKCLRNYYNQKLHDNLNRSDAAAFLRRWIGEMGTQTPPEERSPNAEGTESPAEAVKLNSDFGMNRADSTWDEIWRDTLNLCTSEKDCSVIQALQRAGDRFRGKEKPFSECEFLIGDASYGCDLLWPRSGVMLFTESYREDYEAAKETAWHCFYTGSMTSPDALLDLLNLLKEE